MKGGHGQACANPHQQNGYDYDAMGPDTSEKVPETCAIALVTYKA